MSSFQLMCDYQSWSTDNKLKSKLQTFHNQIPKNQMKWNSLVFVKNKVCMYLFKSRKVWNVIYCKCLKKVLKFSQNSRENSCVGFSILKNLHTSGVQLYQKKRLWHMYFPVNWAEFLRTVFFRIPSNNCFWILQMKIKLLKTKFPINGFTISKFHIQMKRLWLVSYTSVTRLKSSLTRL